MEKKKNEEGYEAISVHQWRAYIHQSSHVSHCWPVFDLSWRNRSSSWVSSVFACHLAGCGGVKGKRNMQSCVVEVHKRKHTERKTHAHTHNRIKNSAESRFEDFSYAFIWDRATHVVSQTIDHIDFFSSFCFPGPNMGNNLLFPFQVFCLKSRSLKTLHCRAIFKLGTFRASSAAVEHV